MGCSDQLCRGRNLCGWSWGQYRRCSLNMCHPHQLYQTDRSHRQSVHPHRWAHAHPSKGCMCHHCQQSQQDISDRWLGLDQAQCQVSRLHMHRLAPQSPQHMLGTSAGPLKALIPTHTGGIHLYRQPIRVHTADTLSCLRSAGCRRHMQHKCRPSLQSHPRRASMSRNHC